jgi:thiamine transport system substrate-binding protein
MPAEGLGSRFSGKHLVRTQSGSARNPREELTLSHTLTTHMSTLHRRAFGLALLAAASLGTAAHAQDKPSLTVYTYSAFTGKYGPGAKVKAAFETTCNCTLNYVSADDAGSLVGRLKLEGDQTKAEIVLGLDMNLAAEAKATGLFAMHGQGTGNLALPVAWTDDAFVPFDWGHLAFIYDSTKMATPPASLKELIEAPNGPRIVLQDPRTSAPGLGLLLWMRQVYGDKADEAWGKLKPRVVTFTKGWSEAYGLFLKGEADMVLSYTTSPAYHIGVEKKPQYKAASFSEGHYLHVELAGLTKLGASNPLAKQFLGFVLSEAFQGLMPEGNWMMPAVTPAAGLPASFADVLKPARTLSFTPAEVLASRRAFIDGWLAATSR